MSKRIKAQPQNKSTTIIKKNALSEPKHISFSFEHEISSKSRHPAGIRDKSNRLSFYEDFCEKMVSMSHESWEEFGFKSKANGYESIPYSRFTDGYKTSFKNCDIISPDSKLDVIRVGQSDNYRVIGKYINEVYYIISYDIDFSAYSH